MTPSDLLTTILPHWRAELPPAISLEYFDDFVTRMRPTLEAMLGKWYERRQSKQATDPDLLTAGARTRRNLEAMRIVATKHPESMTVEERHAVLGYSGWGGLSIERVTDQFPPGFVPDTFALLHEYYTPTRVAEAIADLVCPRLPELAGFDGIVRALEPSVGIGRLVRALGPPRCLVVDPKYKETRWTAIELSDVSAKMFAAMRPDVALHSMSLEQWMSEHAAHYQGTLGLVVANPPYGQRGEFALQDKHPDYKERTAYAYFMRRCLDLLIPAGLGIFVVPAGFLTGANNQRLREKVLLRHHLEVAFRLPSESAKGVSLFPGATNVVDVLVWRARGGQLRQVDDGDQFIVEGAYFRENPSHLLGTEVQDDEKGRNRYRVIGDFSGFPTFTPRPICTSCAIGNLPMLTAQPVVRVTRDSDEIADVDDELKLAIDLGRRVDRYLALVSAENPRAIDLWPELVQALGDLKNTPALKEIDGNPWRWTALRKLAERRALAQRLLAAYQKTGALIPALAEPPDIRPKFSAQANDVLAQAEHLFRSRRRLTVDELKAFHNDQDGTLTRDEILAAVLDAEWNIDGERWDELVPLRSYLSGLLWPKYDRAKQRAATDPQAAKQLRRLNAVMNLAVYEDIRGVSPRQGWVPLDLVSQWLMDTLNRGYGRVRLTRASGLVQVDRSHVPAHLLEVAADFGFSADDITQEFVIEEGEVQGREALKPEAQWVLGWMNHDLTTFRPRKLSKDEIKKLIEEDRIAEGRPDEDVADEDADEDDEEEASLGLLRELFGRRWSRQFTAWIEVNATRRHAIEEAYNRAFRGSVVPTYEGDNLPLARWTETGPQLKAHQVAGVRRILDLRGGLIAYDVGVGKTYTAIGVVAAARQEGWVRRPVILVPSSLVWKWHDDFLCVMPDYRVAVIGSNRKEISRGPRKGLITSVTDTPQQRADKWTAFQAGLYDVVVLSYDALGRTKINEESLVEYVNTVDSLKRDIKLRQQALSKKKGKLSERERAILEHGVRAFVEEQLELPEGHIFDPGIAWDDIGIDLLVVDEAANFKNSHKPGAREHGLPKFMGGGGDGSKRAWQLDFRASVVRRRTGGSGIVLLTATPAKNSPLEFYNLIQLVDPFAFAKRGLMDPEQFISRFLRIESREIVDITLNTSLRSVVDGFQNLDELRMIIKTYGEFRSAEEVNLTLPEPRSEQVHVQLGPGQEQLYAEHAAKLEAAVKAAHLPSNRNMILATLARLSLIALHGGLSESVAYENALTAVDRDDWASPKLTACAERIAASRGCGHIVFCEPTAVHKWLREVLAAHKIPRERIAILNAIETQAADRVRIARDFNGIASDPPAPGSCAQGTSQRIPPKYDVIIANSVAYEGIDLQTRTCSIHHLDLPWTPADLEQRNGRAVRQGNTLPVVQIYYYLSERSMDWYRYTLIQGKRGWLGDLLASQAKDTSNPGAQQALSDEEILLMISRDPEATQKALEARRESLRVAAHLKMAKEAANLLSQASARFRDARETPDLERAAQLRSEGAQRLRDLGRIDPVAWPWARWAVHAQDTEVLVASPLSPPVYDGLRIGTGPVGERTYHEFGRIVTDDQTRLIAMREHGEVTWKLVSTQEIRELGLQPEHLEAGLDWPDEDLLHELEIHVDAEISRYSPSISALQWRGASDAWLTRWWPKVAKTIAERLALSIADTTYPLERDGELVLASGQGLTTGDLMAPTAAGWQRFLELAPTSKAKFTELRTLGRRWWERVIPRDLLAKSNAEAETTAAETTIAAVSTAAAETAAKKFAVKLERDTDRFVYERPGSEVFNLVARPGSRAWQAQKVAGDQDGYHVAVFPEGEGPQKAVAVADVGTDNEIRAITWKSRSVSQDNIRDRLQDQIQRSELPTQIGDTLNEFTTEPLIYGFVDPAAEDQSERLHKLLWSLERRGPQLGVRLEDVATLRDLAKPRIRAGSLWEWLDNNDFDGIAAVLEAARKQDSLALRRLIRDLWTSVVDATATVTAKDGLLGVADDAVFEDEQSFVLLSSPMGNHRRAVRRIDVEDKTEDRYASTRMVRDPSNTLKSGDRVHNSHNESLLTELYDRLHVFCDDLERAPETLATVRGLLAWTAQLIEAPRCQGDVKRRATMAFKQAKHYYDAAREQLAEGRPIAVVHHMQQALERISEAAAQLAESCAEGQLDLLAVGPDLPVHADDAATLAVASRMEAE